jgi:hypothetical protein
VDVTNRGVDSCAEPGVAYFLLHVSKSTGLDQRLASRFRRRNALANLTFRHLVEIPAQLGIQIRFEVITANEVGE